jgi:hypothetical protein
LQACLLALLYARAFVFVIVAWQEPLLAAIAVRYYKAFASLFASLAVRKGFCYRLCYMARAMLAATIIRYYKAFAGLFASLAMRKGFCLSLSCGKSYCLLPLP